MLQQGDQKKVQGRVFTMSAEQAAYDPSVVEGKILISGILANALIDFAATHSFASNAFVRKLGTTPECLEVNYSVTIPSGDEIISNQILRACQILIDGRSLYANFVVLNIQDFDVILGMDWLTKYHAIIDCNRK